MEKKLIWISESAELDFLKQSDFITFNLWEANKLSVEPQAHILMNTGESYIITISSASVEMGASKVLEDTWKQFIL